MYISCINYIYIYYIYIIYIYIIQYYEWGLETILQKKVPYDVSTCFHMLPPAPKLVTCKSTQKSVSVAEGFPTKKLCEKLAS